ncbi:hypothetical protein U0B34_25030, partial [Escherichia coli]|nr:hypothetical protein [Escherichia coli]
NHTNRPLTDFGGKTSIFSHPVYLFLREFSLQDFRGGSVFYGNGTFPCLCGHSRLLLTHRHSPEMCRNILIVLHRL